MEAANTGIEILGPPCSPTSALQCLTEPLRAWFRHRFGMPSASQCFAWQAICAGKNVLVSSPTGTGKTLAAFLPIISRLSEEPAEGGSRCLYISPMKALANDVRRSLRVYLREIRAWNEKQCVGAPEMSPADQNKWIRCTAPSRKGVPGLRIGLRTGDTSARARWKLRLLPPDILLTTPESLALMLSQSASMQWFAGLQTVIMDEVHALAANKRGADLALSLERLDGITNQSLQRVGLSATCTPLIQAARFLVGAQRACAVAQVRDTAPLHLTIEPLEDTGAFMDGLAARLEPELESNRTTLIFANTRGLAERLGWVLSRRYPRWADEIAVHHSSLSMVRRRSVERRLKNGRLRAVVSSTSLELGIDIGNVDLVVLVHPPGDAVRLLQRVGRAGHGPGRQRQGLVLTASPSELLEAVVTGASVHADQLEPLQIPEWPLDVLCQQMVGMAAQRPWQVDEAFEVVCRAYPYRALPRKDFDGCLDYLSGRRSNGQAWLPPRLRWTGDEFRILDTRTARLLRMNVGTIISDESRKVALLGLDRGASNFAQTPEIDQNLAVVGEVDEAFAERLKPGDRFLLDGRCLECRRVGFDELVVSEVVGRPAVPRWGTEGLPLSPELAYRVYGLRIRAAEALRDGRVALRQMLAQESKLHELAAETLVAFFERQESLSEIPDGRTCLIECVQTGWGVEWYVHTPLNRSGNDAIARVVVGRLAPQTRGTVASMVADLGFMICGDCGHLTHEVWRHLLALPEFDADFMKATESSHALRDRFRKVALTGLMLLRNPLGGRRRVGGPDWAERRLYEKLHETEPDFILLRQAFREAANECCDVPAATKFLQNLADTHIRVRHLPHVSPFAEAWTQTEIGAAVVESQGEVLERLHETLTRRRSILAG